MTEAAYVRWIDAFPWVAAVADSTTRWWLAQVDPPGSEKRAQRLSDLSGLMMERLSDWTVPQLFVGLPLDTGLSTLTFSNRATNVFARMGFRTIEDLQGVKVSDMLDWRQVGAGAVDGILVALADAATDVDPERSPQSEFQQLKRRDDVSWSVIDGTQELRETVLQDLELIARWLVAKGHPDEALLTNGVTAGAGTPTEVAEARHRIAQLTAADLLESEELRVDAAEQLRCAFAKLTQRDLYILSKRFFADAPITLDVLGREFEVTRERIRQLETKARSSLVELIQPGGDLAMVAAAARETIGRVLPLSALLTALPSLAARIDDVAQPGWRVLDRLDDEYEIEDGWCAAPSVAAASADLATLLEELANEYGLVQLDDLGRLNEYLPLEEDRKTQLAWIAYCEFPIIQDYVLTRTAIPDRICAMLFLEGAPMTTDEIITGFAGERSSSSIRNAMAVDKRVVKIDRDRWALAEWGVEAYEGIRAAIRKELTVNGGAVSLGNLQTTLAAKYNVSPASVHSYSALAPFELDDGYVRFARSASRKALKSPVQTRRFFRHREGWSLRVTITKDHIRGSGFVAPTSVAQLLGLSPGDSIILGSADRGQKVYWTGTQPSIGSVRRFLLSADIDAGEQVFMEFLDDRSFSLRRMGNLDGDALHDVLTLVGADPNSVIDARKVLASAIELPEEASVSTLIDEFQSRGDSDISELILRCSGQLAGPEAKASEVDDVDIDDLLDLL